MFMSKAVVVVGGTSGIGLGVVKAFQDMSYDVLSIGRAVCDIRDENKIDACFSKLDRVDILINNAAINYCKQIQDITMEEWREVLDVNLTSFFYIIKKCLPLMPRGSKIVNVSSIAGRSKSIVSGVHYTSSKAGIIGMTRQLAQELGPIGININCVCPSQTLTPMLKKSMSQDQLDALEKKIPLRRLATVENIVEPILFLCSEKSSYIHGACIDINGGQL
tara:strand:- start:53 stop:712 length:660 start_codon:yes stop_codon:yes gene_type:complete